jgi:excinuclease ABC subunit B
VDFFGDDVEAVAEIDPLRGTLRRGLSKTAIFPASHYVTQQRTLKRATASIIAELKERIAFFRSENRLLEAQRIEERTHFDLEMLQELGYCNGIENYSRHLTGRTAGDPPPTLMDYFPDDYLVFIDESHISVPQLRAMYRGDRSRKETLVKYGFRLPSALDNRPLRFEEFEARVPRVLYVSATPAEYERHLAGDAVAEQIVRPTGLVDPRVEVRPARHQVDDLLDEIRRCTAAGQRILVTTLTKRMAEDLTEYYRELGFHIRYLHADIPTMERMEIIQDLRAGEFDVLVGINLLREGLDIPEVASVAIMDADKEGFLRSARSLIQTFGRAARNAEGRVILYADTVTPAMAQAMEETERRRAIQLEFNLRHGITPQTIVKEVHRVFAQAAPEGAAVHETVTPLADPVRLEEVDRTVEALKQEMHAAARDLEFERAAALRDRIRELQRQVVLAAE